MNSANLTVDDLIHLMPEIERKFENIGKCPNPADIHPETFAAIHQVCKTLPMPYPETTPFEAVVLHVRTDVEPWKMHPCTCQIKAVTERLKGRTWRDGE